jgi:hypothetical protein
VIFQVNATGYATTLAHCHCCLVVITL